MEKIEGYKLSENQVNLLSLNTKSIEQFYNQTIIQLKENYSSEEIGIHIKKTIESHEVLSYKLFSSAKTNYPIQFLDNNAEDIQYWYYNEEVAYKDFEKIAEAELGYPYNPNENKAIRVGVLVVSGYVRYIVVRLYSLFGDLYSCLYLSEEILGRIKGKSNDDEKIEYHNYCSWQNDLLEEPEEEAELFWKAYNSRPQNQILPFGKKSEHFVPGKKTILSIDHNGYSGLIKNLAALDQNIDSYALLVFNKYLSSFTADQYITIGYNNQSRSYDELLHTVGFVNAMLALNMKTYSHSLNLSENLEDIKKNVEAVKNWGDYFTLNRKKQNSTYFKYCFEYINTGNVIKDSDFEVANIYSVQDIFDVKLTVTDSGKDLTIDLYTNDDLFSSLEKELIEAQFKNIFIHLLNGNPLKITEADQKIIDASNATEVSIDKETTWIDLFESQARLKPDQTAIVFENNKLTYKELDELSNQMADYLKNKYTVQPYDLVCIQLPRSEKVIVSLLGILKSGAAYVPVDVDYPKERIEYIIQDSNANVVINEDEYDVFLSSKSEYCTDNAARKVHAENLAYVIYTSGTTGNPKGVGITHSNIINYILWSNGFYFTEKDRGNWGLFTSVAFDLSGTAIFCSLSRGSQLWLAGTEEDTLVTLVNMLENSEIDILKLTPSHISLLKDVGIENTNIRKIILGGEKLSQDHIEIIQSINKEIEIYDEYGPTETTIGCTAHQVTLPMASIGKPISNTQIHILDENLEACPIGTIGEIYIAGSGVAKGYLNHAELTEKKFVENPFVPGTKMYRSGDLGRWLSNGTIEYMGRIDHQVKIRGHRIELEEIDQCILSYSDLIKGAVTECRENNGDKNLIAYYTAGSPVDKRELLNYLENKLPKYMLPAFYVELPGIPLTPNGKVDRKSLPDVEASDRIRNEYVAPRNEVEEKMLDIWKEILNTENIGIKDNFFDLGGHSLILIRIINKIKIVFNKTITIKDFIENPTVELTSVLVMNSENSEVYTPIPNIEKSEYYPVTPSQYRFWVIHQNENIHNAYNISQAFNLLGELDISKLEKSFQYLVNRHEILRTVFVHTDNILYQKVLGFENIDFEVEFLDLSDSADKEKQVEELLNAKDIVFALDQFPLFKILLIHTDKNEHILWFNMHHIISDGWSNKLFASEFIKVYNAQVKNTEVDLPGLTIQYKDYADWINKKDAVKDRNFWKEILSGELPKMELPFSKTRKSVQTHQGQNLPFLLPSETLTDIKAALSKDSTSLFTFLNACIKVVLSRYTGQKDVITGTVLSGRDHPDLEHQLGLFLNTIPLRSQISDDDTLNTFIKKEKQIILEAFDHGSYTFDQILDDIDYQRDLDRSALYDVSVVLNNFENMSFSEKSEEFDDLRIEDHQSKYDVSKNDIEFSFSESGNQLFGSITYNVDLYDRDSIERLNSHLKNMIHCYITAPDIKISDLDYLEPKEKELLIQEFNASSVIWPEEGTIISLFEKQSAQHPEQVAVVFEDTVLSYNELNNKAAALACHLQTNFGIQKGDQVGVMLSRSEKQIISMLGILKAGAVYVPVDASLPDARKAVISKGIQLLITESDVLEMNFYSGKSLAIDAALAEENGEGFTSVDIEGSDIAYIIYTSGSTGEPKGVLNSHSGILNTMLSQIQLFEINRYNRVGQFASFSFDASISEIFMALLSGKCLYILNDEVRKDPNAFEEYIADHEIDIMTLPPAFFSLLNTERLKPLKAIITAGEDAVLGKTKEYLQYGTFYNAYGPTETSICATVYKIDKGQRIDSNKIPIGKPIANTRIYILDANKQMVPIGVAGELYIAGAGLAQGYLNLPELTGERFVDNPFEAGTKMYRTGDLGHWLSDGNIEYLGRTDHQVKVRGHRIELGEIDSQVLAYSSSIKTVVTEVKDYEGDKSLVVYYVSESPVDKLELSKYLGSKLPQYMLPSFYVALDHTPLMHNGKIDRKSLPEVSSSDLIHREYVAPTTHLEEQLVEIWQEILGVDQIGTTNNFFELGGNSMNAIRIIGEIQKKLNKVIKVNVFLEAPRICELATVIEQLEDTEEKVFRTII